MTGSHRAAEEPLLSNVDGDRFSTDSDRSNASLADPVFERVHFKVSDMVPSRRDKLAFGLIAVRLTVILEPFESDGPTDLRPALRCSSH